MHAEYTEYIVGYRALGEYTDRPPQYWRTRASDGMLPFPRYRLPGRQVGFLKTDVDQYEEMAKGKEDWYGEPLSISLAGIHAAVETAAAELDGLLVDQGATDQVLQITRPEDAKRIRDQLMMVIQRAAVLWIPAATAAGKAMTPKGNQFAHVLQTEGFAAALGYIQHDFAFFADVLQCSLEVEYDTGGGYLSETGTTTI